MDLVRAQRTFVSADGTVDVRVVAAVCPFAAHPPGPAVDSTR